MGWQGSVFLVIGCNKEDYLPIYLELRSEAFIETFLCKFVEQLISYENCHLKQMRVSSQSIVY